MDVSFETLKDVYEFCTRMLYHEGIISQEEKELAFDLTLKIFDGKNPTEYLDSEEFEKGMVEREMKELKFPGGSIKISRPDWETINELVIKGDQKIPAIKRLRDVSRKYLGVNPVDNVPYSLGLKDSKDAVEYTQNWDYQAKY